MAVVSELLLAVVSMRQGAECFQALVGLLVLVQALKEENIKVLTVNPAQTSTHMTWDRPDSEYIPDKMIQVCGPDSLLVLASAVSLNKCIFTCSYLEDLHDAADYKEAAQGVEG